MFAINFVELTTKMQNIKLMKMRISSQSYTTVGKFYTNNPTV